MRSAARCCSCNVGMVLAWPPSRSTAGAFGVACAAPLTQRRYQTRIPNKGYRRQPAVPDRMKDAMTTFGVDVHNVSADEDPPYVQEHQRQRMVQQVMSSSQNLKSLSKLDRLRSALDRVRNEPAGHEKWNEVYLFLRTTEMCTEVVANDSDVMPKGKKLWIEMELCEEKRVPVLMTLPNGMPVLPIFTMEEYMDAYFSRTNVFDSCWFPVPRNGTQWEEFCKLPFPVCVTGSIQHFSALATVALGSHQLGILVNPGMRTSKFISYPEMVSLTRLRQQQQKNRRRTVTRCAATDGSSTAAAVEESLFDENLMMTFDTTKMPLTRLEPQDLAACMAQRPPIPPVAELELHLLLHVYPEIESVYIRTVDRPRWRRMLGASEKMTQIDVVCDPEHKPDKCFFEHLRHWSFMKEFNSDVHVELTSQAPVQVGSTGAFMCVYSNEVDGKPLRAMSTFKGRTLADQLGFNEPITDAQGNKPYERNVSYF
ncbi:hypothetical protein GH5_01212 [Leishmania sp. Ghana 2012 LV757]|uniref:hypothetical protein n=1 Tax=Leishmania sp. Ghana 2012 LV757 TaxID=2803181 RepID=UPI001B5887DF|nr:hypothetical protein GH5_01212 [Leishmania sp. Ghana 2012 LV757]